MDLDDLEDGWDLESSTGGPSGPGAHLAPSAPSHHLDGEVKERKDLESKSDAESESDGETDSKKPKKALGQTTPTKYMVFVKSFGHDRKNAILKYNKWVERFKELVDDKLIQYIQGQLECGGKKNRYHIQGHVDWPKKIRFTAANKIFTAHFKMRYGNRGQNIKYCTAEAGEKPGPRVDGTEPFQFGEPKGDVAAKTEGKREALIKDIKDGVPLKQAAWRHPGAYCSMRNGAKDLAAFLCDDGPRPESEERRIIVLWGNSGAGKTRRAKELAKEVATALKLHVAKNVKFVNNFWIGYQGEGVIIINEIMDSGKVPIDDFLAFTDPWDDDCLNIKNWHDGNNSRLIIITGQKHPRDWYPGAFKNAHILRRVTEVVKVKGGVSESEGELDWSSKEREI